MRVPTYRQETGRTSKGQGRLLTAQLNPRAMAAPMLAVQDAGNALMAYGIEKYKIQVDTQVGQATNYLTAELQAIQDEAIYSTGDPIVAEDKAKTKMAQLVKDVNDGTKFIGGEPLLTNRTAKNQFAATSFQLLNQQLRQLRKENFQNVQNQRVANINFFNERALDIAANLNRSMDQRLTAIDDVLNTSYGSIAAGVKDRALSPNDGMTYYDNFNDDVVRAIAQKFMETNDPMSVAFAIEDRSLDDQIFTQAFDNLAPEAQQTVIDDMFTIAEAKQERANAIEEAKTNQQEQEWQEDFNFIINQGKNKPDEARARYQKLLGANWFTPQNKAHAEVALGLADPKKTEIKSSRDSIEILNNALATNTYTPELLKYHADFLSDGDYEQYYGYLASEAEEGKSAAIQQLRYFTGANEFKDTSGRLDGAADAFFREAVLRMNKIVNDRSEDGIVPTYQEYINIATTIQDEMQERITLTITRSLIEDMKQLGNLNDIQIEIDEERPAQSALESINKFIKEKKLDPMLVTGTILEIESLMFKFGIK